jgi:Type II CAAX prenyl endopeptidase Rce1-like
MPERLGYLESTRHPWPCLLFLLPLLAVYEGGVVWLGGTRPDVLRNGVDAWLRWGLEHFGLHQLYWLPGVIVLVFLVWSWLRSDERPAESLGVLTGMGLESLAFAVGLWGLSQGLAGLLNGQAANVPAAGLGSGQVITFVGAGIYEEVVFRLLLFSLLAGTLRLAETPLLVEVGFAALGSAVCFAVAHHLGPYGERFDSAAFLFRLLAGVYFALLFRLRGFGIAVGAHACYDVFVGVAIG